MLKQIHKWRAKPEGTRRRLHIGLTIIIMALIVTGWAFVFSNRIQVALSGKGSSNIASPFATLKNDLTANIEQIREGYLVLKGKK